MGTARDVLPARRRRGWTATVLAAAVLVAMTACGGDAEEPEPTPQGAPEAGESSSPSESPSESASPSDAPSPTPTAKPLSRFEDEPQVKAVRGFAAAVGRSVNRNDAELSAARRFMTTEGSTFLGASIEEDLGLYYPGPLPLTPLRVVDTGPRSAEVRTCVWAEGWALKGRGGLPARNKAIEPYLFLVERERGAWRVDNIEDLDADCESVKVKGVPW